MKFYLYMQQEGEGCDYTIGCAQKLLELKAATIEEARVEVEKVFGDYGVAGSHMVSLERAMIMSIAETVDVAAYVSRIKDANDQVARQAKAEAERAEYDRLRKKYGEG